MSHRNARIAAVATLVSAAVGFGLWWAIRDRREPSSDSEASRARLVVRRGRTAEPAPMDRGSPARPAAAPRATAHRVAPPSVQTELAALPMDAAVRAVVGLETNRTDATARRTALRALTRELTAPDVAALRLFLRASHADQADGLDAEHFFALKNDVLDILVRQEQLPGGLGVDLAAMSRDGSQDVVWRDYCVQYLADCLARLPGADASAHGDAVPEAVAEEREAILQAMEDALGERGTTIAGTALIGLEQVSRADPSLDRDAVLRAAASLAMDDAACEATRITALRVAALMGGQGALPAARMLAQVGETDTLRLAAVATLGDAGSAEDLQLLHAISATADSRMRPVVAGALKRLEDRLARPSPVEGGS